ELDDLGRAQVVGGDVASVTGVVTLEVAQGIAQHPLDDGLDGPDGLHRQTVASGMVTVAEPLAFNPFDPGFRTDPYSIYRRLLAEDPVHHTPFGFLALSRYEDCAAVLRDHRSSSDPRTSIYYEAFMAGRDEEEVLGELAGFRP